MVVTRSKHEEDDDDFEIEEMVQKKRVRRKFSKKSIEQRQRDSKIDIKKSRSKGKHTADDDDDDGFELQPMEPKKGPLMSMKARMKAI